MTKTPAVFPSSLYRSHRSTIDVDHSCKPTTFPNSPQKKARQQKDQASSRERQQRQAQFGERGENGRDLKQRQRASLDRFSHICRIGSTLIDPLQRRRNGNARCDLARSDRDDAYPHNGLVHLNPVGNDIREIYETLTLRMVRPGAGIEHDAVVLDSRFTELGLHHRNDSYGPDLWANLIVAKHVQRMASIGYDELVVRGAKHNERQNFGDGDRC